MTHVFNRQPPDSPTLIVIFGNFVMIICSYANFVTSNVAAYIKVFQRKYIKHILRNLYYFYVIEVDVHTVEFG